MFSLLHGSNIFSSKTCLQSLFPPSVSPVAITVTISFMLVLTKSVNSILKFLLRVAGSYIQMSTRHIYLNVTQTPPTYVH